MTNKSQLKGASKKHIKIPSQSLINRRVEAESQDMKDILAVMEKLLHWAAIIDSTDDAVITKSIEGYITSWNRGAQRLYGYTPEEIIGKPVSVLMPPEKEDDFPFIMNQLLAGKRVDHYETKRQAKDGRVIDVSITVSPIRDSYGNIIGASKIARDITERVELERRRNEFVSTASHELKTPLTSQKAFGELLEKLIDENGHTEYKRYIQKINQQTDKLTKLIEDLLNLSRVQTGGLKLEFRRFALNKLIHEVVENMQMTTHHHLIVENIPKVQIRGDKERIGQVITNLLSNAIKYSPNADKVIVSAKQTNGSIVVSIQDFGIGISPKYHQKIFERFFRVSDDDEKTFPGMGIGLHVCAEIITRHNGKIWLESEKGKGTTFFFSLPVKK